ncbi:MAG: GntR family transcriptional regulator [Oscillospiraceae bacterium]|nr:GntR family transcriptional regulator [Oscillospiraceae bacterium]
MGSLQDQMNGWVGSDIYDKLKEDIISLKLKPGQMISENSVAGEYGVSRTPIKNAFLRLKGEKYIEIIPQKGSYVTLLDMNFIKDIIYMRAVLEYDMHCSIVKQDLTESVCQILEENLARQSEVIHSARLSPTTFYEVDSLFHLALFKAAGRERMWDIIQDCQVYYARFRLLDTLLTQRYEELYSEHVEIFNALKSKDLPKIKSNVFDHLHGNLKALSNKIENEYREYFLK